MIPYHRIPILFHIGSLRVYSWGFFVSLGILTALIIANKNHKKESKTITDLVIITLIFGILGARTIYVLLNIKHFIKNPIEAFNIMGGGLSYFGALLFAFIALLTYCKITKKDYKHYLDIFAIYIPIVQAIGRIGCFLNGCCYGSLTRVPWGITYLGGIRHPAQIYESILDITIFLVLYKIRNKKSLKILNRRIRLFKGSKFLLYLILYSLVRFVVEFFRQEPKFIFGLTITQIITIFIIIVSKIIILRKQRL